MSWLYESFHILFYLENYNVFCYTSRWECGPFVICVETDWINTSARMISLVVVVVQLPSRVWLFAMPWTAARQVSLSLTISQSLPMFIVSVMLSSLLILGHPLLLLPSIFASIRDFFQWVICLHQMTKLLDLQHKSFQWIFRVDLPEDWLVWSPCCPRDFQESSPAQRFKGINSWAFCLLLWSSSHNRMWPLVGYMNLKKERVFFWNIFWLSRCCQQVLFVNNLQCRLFRIHRMLQCSIQLGEH